MKRDDIVVYTERHADWLKTAERWPKSRRPKDFLGVVVGVDGIVVEVLWAHDPRPTKHFADNLELL